METYLAANKIIHIYGASGSGTTTLAKYISETLNYTFMDTDDYFWKPTNPPYKEKRNVSERLIYELFSTRKRRSIPHS